MSQAFFPAKEGLGIFAAAPAQHPPCAAPAAAGRGRAAGRGDPFQRQIPSTKIHEPLRRSQRGSIQIACARGARSQ